MNLSKIIPFPSSSRFAKYCQISRVKKARIARDLSSSCHSGSGRLFALAYHTLDTLIALKEWPLFRGSLPRGLFFDEFVTGVDLQRDLCEEKNENFPEPWQLILFAREG
jgi:hypothetical protein